MSKYDDIQRFKEKVNMKGIDYKEFPKDDGASSLHRWAIVEQVADHGGTLPANQQPVPAKETDFFSTASSSVKHSAQPTATVNVNNAGLDHISHHFEHLTPQAAVPPKPSSVPSQEKPRVRVSSVQSPAFTAASDEASLDG